MARAPESPKSLGHLHGMFVLDRQPIRIAMSALNEKTMTTEAQPPVQIRTPSGPCLVLGQKKPALTKREYEAVKVLLDAYPSEIDTVKFEQKVGKGGHEVLARLRKKDSAWAAVILMPTRTGRGGYRLTSSRKQ